MPGRTLSPSDSVPPQKSRLISKLTEEEFRRDSVRPKNRLTSKKTDEEFQRDSVWYPEPEDADSFIAMPEYKRVQTIEI